MVGQYGQEQYTVKGVVQVADINCRNIYSVYGNIQILLNGRFLRKSWWIIRRFCGVCGTDFFIQKDKQELSKKQENAKLYTRCKGKLKKIWKVKTKVIPVMALEPVSLKLKSGFSRYQEQNRRFLSKTAYY